MPTRPANPNLLIKAFPTKTMIYGMDAILNKMSKTKSLKLSFSFLIFTLFSILHLNVVLAYVPPTDKITLYENGKRVTDSSYMHSGYFYKAPICRQGVCNISRETNNITLYKITETSVFDYEEWIELYENDRNAYDEYIQGVKNDALYTVTLRTGQTKEEAESVGPREYNFDVITKVLTLTFAEKASPLILAFFKPYQLVIISIVVFSIIFLVFWKYFFRR